MIHVTKLIMVQERLPTISALIGVLYRDILSLNSQPVRCSDRCSANPTSVFSYEKRLKNGG